MPNLRRWSSTASGNASIAGGASTINWAEGQLPSTVNNSMREASAQIRSIYKPSEWGWVEHSATASVASQTTFKIAADVTADYVQGRRVRLTGGSTIMYGNIVSSSFTAQTTITLTKDSGSLSASMSIAAVAAVYDKNTPNYVTIVKKTANETVNNSSALQDDDHLFFAVLANTDYEFEFDFFYSSAAAADFNLTVTGPAAPTLVYFVIEFVLPDATGGGVAGRTDIFTAFAFSVTTGGAPGIVHASGTVGHVRLRGILHNGANAGTVQLQWAQATANASNTVVRKGGTLRHSFIA